MFAIRTTGTLALPLLRQPARWGSTAMLRVWVTPGGGQRRSFSSFPQLPPLYPIIPIDDERRRRERRERQELLEGALRSLRLPGSSPSSGVIIPTGAPTGTVDAATLVDLVRELGRRLAPKGEFVFVSRAGLRSHEYVALRKISPTLEQLVNLGITLDEYRRAVSSPRGFFVSWMLGFPLGATVEYASSAATVFRLMGEDPVAVGELTGSVVLSGENDVRVTQILSVNDLGRALTAPSVDETSGALVLGFTARTCWDTTGPSHALIGTVFHVRIIDYDADLPEVWEMRIGVGGGTFIGGIPNNAVAFPTWRVQFANMEQMYLRRQYYELLEALDLAGSPEAQLRIVEAWQTQFSHAPTVLALLNRLAGFYRRFQRSRTDLPKIGDRFIVKEL